MTRRSPLLPWFALLLGLLLVAPALSGQGTATEPTNYVTVGDTKASVIQRLGWPTGSAAANNREVLTYPQGEVILVDGKVVQVRAASNAPAPQQYRPRPKLPGSSTAPAPAPSTPSPAVRPRPTLASPPSPEPPRPLPPVRQPTAAPPANPFPSTFTLLRGPLLFFAIIGGVVLIVATAARTAARQQRKLRDDLDRYGRTTRNATPAERCPSPPRYTPPHASEPPPLPCRPTEVVRPMPSPFDGPLTFELIDALEWRRFEELTAAYFRTQGFRTEQTGFGGDGGIDLKLYRDSRPEPYAIVQCKAHSGQVKVEPVRAFFGVMAADQFAHGYFVSSNGFTKPALDFAHGKSLLLISGQQLLDSLNYLPADTLASLRRDVWRDDYHTPTCPRCGIKMVRRESETPFWGCSRFPDCNHTIPMRATER